MIQVNRWHIRLYREAEVSRNTIAEIKLMSRFSNPISRFLNFNHGEHEDHRAYTEIKNPQNPLQSLDSRELKAHQVVSRSGSQSKYNSGNRIHVSLLISRFLNLNHKVHEEYTKIKNPQNPLQSVATRELRAHQAISRSGT